MPADPSHVPIADVRPLRPDERLLIAWLVENGIPAARRFAEQLPGARVVSRCGCGCPTIDLAIDGCPAVLEGMRTILADATAVSPEGVRVGVILHARNGFLSELEIYSVAGDVGAFSLPRIADLEII